MVSPNEPGLLFSQGFYNEYPQGQIGGAQAFPYPYHHCIAALTGDTDNKLTWSGTSPIVGRSTFVALLQSAPFYLEQDDYKRNKWLQLKLRASRNVTTACMSDSNFAKTETIGIWSMSENAHFDVLDCSVSSAELQDITPSGTVASGDGVVQPWRLVRRPDLPAARHSAIQAVDARHVLQQAGQPQPAGVAVVSRHAVHQMHRLLG
jgi:hypothetical protein